MPVTAHPPKKYIKYVKFSKVNEDTDKWCFNNNIKIIETDEFFSLPWGDVDDMFFSDNDEHPYSILNRFGAIRLLRTVDKQCFNLCGNWEINQLSMKFMF